MWRQPSSNLFWKCHHLTKIFWKTTAPFLTFRFCPKSLKELFSTNFSPISKKTTSATPFSQPIEQSCSPQTSLPSPRKQPLQPLSASLSSRTQHRDRFVLYMIFSPLWTMTSPFFFYWIFLQLLTLTTTFSSPAWTLFLAFSLLHSSGFILLRQISVHFSQ